MIETKHVFGPNGHVADIKGGTKYYYHSDHLGSLRQETDEQGNALWSSPAQYEPFGELRSGGAQNEDGYFYTGKLRDTSTGLYYYGARFYDAKVGRFITKDMIAGKLSEPRTQNRYVYVVNNPLKYNDPTGNFLEDDDGGNGPITPTCKGSCQAKVTKHPVDQLRLLEKQLNDAIRNLKETGGWGTIQALLNAGNTLGAVGAIFKNAGIEYSYGVDDFGDCIIVKEYNEPIYIYDATDWGGMEGYWGLTGRAEDTNKMTIALNFDKDYIQLAGDLFLTLGHELHHAIIGIYYPDMPGRTNEAIAIEWTYNEMWKVNQITSVSNSFMIGTWYKYWLPFSWIGDFP